MLLFPKEQHDDIKAGFITVTFRDWDKIRVETGSDYKSFNLGYVHVDEVGYVDFKKIPDEDIKAAGYEDLNELRKDFRKKNPGFNFGSGKMIRVKFVYLGAEQKKAGGVTPNERELIKIMERLVEIDVMSELNVKCDEMLEFLSTRETINSMTLSKQFNLSLEDTKKRMTQLKNEGLVTSKREGYTLTLRGKTYLDSKI